MMRWFAAAYQADNGNIIPITTPNAIRQYAEEDAVALRSDDDTTEVFVATREVPDWERAAEDDS